MERQNSSSDDEMDQTYKALANTCSDPKMPKGTPSKSQRGDDEPYIPSGNTEEASAEVPNDAISTPKKRKSAAGRKLMRWDPSVDQWVLLMVDYICAREGVNIPWDTIANEIRDWMSGEAIKQHLVKLRNTRERAGLPVPPKLERSARRRANAKGSSQSTPTGHSGDDEVGDSSLLWLPPPKKGARTPRTGTPKTPKSNKKAQNEEDNEDENDEDVTSAKSKKSTAKRDSASFSRKDSDPDFDTPSKRFKTNSLRARALVNYKEQLEGDEDGDDDDEDDSHLLYKRDPCDEDEDYDENAADGGSGKTTHGAGKTIPGSAFGPVKKEQSSPNSTSGITAAPSDPFTSPPKNGQANGLPILKNFSRPFVGNTRTNDMGSPSTSGGISSSSMFNSNNTGRRSNPSSGLINMHLPGPDINDGPTGNFKEETSDEFFGDSEQSGNHTFGHLSTLQKQMFDQAHNELKRNDEANLRQGGYPSNLSSGFNSNYDSFGYGSARNQSSSYNHNHPYAMDPYGNNSFYTNPFANNTGSNYGCNTNQTNHNGMGSGKGGGVGNFNGRGNSSRMGQSSYMGMAGNTNNMPFGTDGGMSPGPMPSSYGGLDPFGIDDMDTDLGLGFGNNTDVAIPRWGPALDFHTVQGGRAQESTQGDNYTYKPRSNVPKTADNCQQGDQSQGGDKTGKDGTDRPSTSPFDEFINCD